jgi:hypothetical protein
MGEDGNHKREAIMASGERVLTVGAGMRVALAARGTARLAADAIAETCLRLRRRQRSARAWEIALRPSV